MSRRSLTLFTLFALVSLAGFFAGWLVREGPSPRALAVVGLTALVALVAGAIAALPRASR